MVGRFQANVFAPFNVHAAAVGRGGGLCSLSGPVWLRPLSGFLAVQLSRRGRGEGWWPSTLRPFRARLAATTPTSLRNSLEETGLWAQHALRQTHEAVLFATLSIFI